ncbi:MAG: carbon storage regulator [Cyanobacteria bacterium P01_H01_bin.74]
MCFLSPAASPIEIESDTGQNNGRQLRKQSKVMLVLTRKTNQKIILSTHTDEVEIVVLDVKGDAIKLGIKAPQNIGIYREELYAEIKASNQAAIGTETDPNVLSMAVQDLPGIGQTTTQKTAQKSAVQQN